VITRNDHAEVLQRVHDNLALVRACFYPLSSRSPRPIPMSEADKMQLLDTMAADLEWLMAAVALEAQRAEHRSAAVSQSA